MILSMLEDVDKTIDEKNIDKDERYDALLEELGIRLQQMQDMQVNSNYSLEKEHAMKTTRKSYYMPPDSSHASKARSGETAKPELPNPNHDPSKTTAAPDTGDGIAVLLTMHNGQDSPSAAAMSFANIQFCNYSASHDYISSHPEILCESETTGLLVEAVKAALDGSRDGKTLELVHQALVLKFCSMLGCDGITKFFKHMTTTADQAYMIFIMDVEERYGRILKLAAKYRAVRRGEPVEQLQIQAPDPGMAIRTWIPDPGNENETVRKVGAIFHIFGPEIKAALESESIEAEFVTGHWE